MGQKKFHADGAVTPRYVHKFSFSCPWPFCWSPATTRLLLSSSSSSSSSSSLFFLSARSNALDKGRGLGFTKRERGRGGKKERKKRKKGNRGKRTRDSVSKKNEIAVAVVSVYRLSGYLNNSRRAKFAIRIPRFVRRVCVWKLFGKTNGSDILEKVVWYQISEMFVSGYFHASRNLLLD